LISNGLTFKQQTQYQIPECLMKYYKQNKYVQTWNCQDIPGEHSFHQLICQEVVNEEKQE
jgi:hypothetical protein